MVPEPPTQLWFSATPKRGAMKNQRGLWLIGRGSAQPVTQAVRHGTLLHAHNTALSFICQRSIR